MQDERTGTQREPGDGHALRVGEQEDRKDWIVLSTLLARQGHAGLWTVAELAQAIEDPLAVADSIGRLRRAGLIHQHEDFVFPTRAATRFNEVVE